MAKFYCDIFIYLFDLRISIAFFELLLRWSRALSPRLECNVESTDQCNFCLPGSSNSPACASWVFETTGARHYAQLIFVFLVEMEFRHIGQAGLKLLTLGDLPASASQSAGITGKRHSAWPSFFNTLFKLIIWERLMYNSEIGTYKYGNIY